MSPRGRGPGVVRTALDAGPDDRVFDSLLLTGPVLVVVIALAGRGLLTTALAVGYLLAFVGHAIRNAVGDG